MANAFLGAFLGVVAIQFAASMIMIASGQGPALFDSSPNAGVIHALFLGFGAIVGCLIGLARTIERSARHE